MLRNLFKRLYRADKASDLTAAGGEAPPTPDPPPAAPVAYSLLDALGEMSALRVLDIGAMMLDGEEAPYSGLLRRGRVDLLAFEPNQAECDKLNREIGAPHLFLPYFIGDGAPATLYETSFAPSSSLYKPNTALLQRFTGLADAVREVARHQVQTHRLDDIAEVGQVDFIKIDVQGSELKVFEGGARALSSALAIHTEVEFVEIYEDQPLFADVDRFLRAQGFRFHTFWSFGQRFFSPIAITQAQGEGVRQQLWADAVYVRDWMALEALSSEQIRKYALMMDEFYDSRDLACTLLLELDARHGTRLAQDYVEDWTRNLLAPASRS